MTIFYNVCKWNETLQIPMQHITNSTSTGTIFNTFWTVMGAQQA